MAMNIIVWEKAKRGMDFSYAWCVENFGLKIADKYLDRIQHDIVLLALFPYMGSAEESLPGMGRSYRYLRVRPHFKLIYFVDEPRAELHVVDFWDTRRDPNQLTTKLTIND